MLHAILPQNRVTTLAQSGIPMIIPSSGTIGNNGALSGLTALHTTYANAYLYFPAGAIYAGSAAGLYYVRMTNTTDGTIYNNTYVSGVPTIPATPTPFVCVGPGAYVQTLTEIALQTITIPGGSIGLNGSLRLIPLFALLSNANNKTAFVRFGGTTIYQWTMTASSSNQIAVIMHNRGVQNSQVLWPTGVNASFGVSNVPTHIAIDSSVDKTLVLSGRLNTAATDFFVLEHYSLEIMRG